LFLQGLATGFFPQLAKALLDRGHAVRRINFNGGDRLFWPLAGAVDFSGGLEDWPAFLKARLLEWGVTDVILFGDCRPYHLVAREIAQRLDIDIHVAEEGYLRPNWITFERGGVNGHSSLPRDPDWYRKAALDTPEWTGGVPVSSVFARRAVGDVLYNVASAALSWRFPDYHSHRPWNPFVEYAGWLRKLAQNPIAKARTAAALKAICQSKKPYFVFPLQLNSDSQLKRHSPFGGNEPALQKVIASFAAWAPRDALLVIREHPLDNGLVEWRDKAQSLADASGVGERVYYVGGGDLSELLAQACALVTVNSTVGVIALALGLPVIALGSAIYDMPELTFQDGLDAFWVNAAAPDPVTFDAFRRVVAARTQVNGGFFSKDGLRLGLEGALNRLGVAATEPQTAMIMNAIAEGDASPVNHAADSTRVLT
jgi:capsular polysaccharide export protein